MKSLAERQAELMSALAGRSPAPPGFDAARVGASARALVNKRERGVSQAWPNFERLLGTEFHATFARYAAAHPPPEHGGPMADGRGFVHWLQVFQVLNDGIRRQALDIDAQFVRTASGWVPRRGPCVRAAWWPESRRWVIVFRWPGLRLRHLRVPALRR